VAPDVGTAATAPAAPLALSAESTPPASAVRPTEREIRTRRRLSGERDMYVESAASA
jgi:hypothetical protein